MCSRWMQNLPTLHLVPKLRQILSPEDFQSVVPLEGDKGRPAFQSGVSECMAQEPSEARSAKGTHGL